MPAHPAHCDNRGGGALAFCLAGCLKCESDAHARKRRSAFWRNEPEVFGATGGAGEDLSRDRMQVRVGRDQAVRHQLIAEQPGLFARGFRGVAAQ